MIPDKEDETQTKQNFKSYKDKVVYILQRYVDCFDADHSAGGGSELRWCLHVI